MLLPTCICINESRDKRIRLFGGAHGVMVIIIGNRRSKLSSNTRKGCLHFPKLLIPFGKVGI